MSDILVLDNIVRDDTLLIVLSLRLKYHQVIEARQHLVDQRLGDIVAIFRQLELII